MTLRKVELCNVDYCFEPIIFSQNTKMINSSNIVLYNYMYMEIIKDRLLDLAVQKYKVMSVSSQ